MDIDESDFTVMEKEEIKPPENSPDVSRPLHFLLFNPIRIGGGL